MTGRAWIVVLVVLWAPAVLGQRLPAPGSRLPNLAFEDLEGREVRLGSFLGRPVLILYEDRTTAAWNRTLKDQLLAMARRKELPPRLMVLPIVDLRAFRAWPARQIAQSQLRSRARELGKPLWADWSGLVAAALGVPGPGPAVVVLLDARHRVVWAGSGRLGPREVRELLSALRVTTGDGKPGPSRLGAPGSEGPSVSTDGTPATIGGASGGPGGIDTGEDRPEGEAPGSGTERPEGTPEDGGALREAGREDSPESPEEDQEAGIPLPPFVIPLDGPPPGGPPAGDILPVRQSLEKGLGLA